MTQLTPAQVELVRTRPQITKLNLVMFSPRVIFQAQVNDPSIARSARSITYDSVSSGSYLNIENGFTLLVGTTAGSDDVGRVRVRSATSSVLTLSENSNINWADNLHLTVLRYVELNPIYPRLIQDPSNAENVLFYKDYDIAYTNQNTNLGTFICMGPHRPVLLNNGTAQEWYTSTGTHSLLGASLTYDWAFEGGSPTGSTAAHPGYVTYTTPGNYVTRLIVTDQHGMTDTSYRYVAVRNKIGEGSNTPIVRWTMDELSGSRGEGGYSVQFTVFDTLTIDDNAIVMLVSDDWYGSTQQSLGGNSPNTSHIFFVGHIQKDSIYYDYEKSFVRFTVVSLSELMKSALGFSVSVESVPSPTVWYQLLDMDVRRALYHYLRWHTTAMMIADFQFVGTDYKIQYFDADRTSMFDAIDNLMRGTLMGQVTADRQDKLWAEVGAEAYPNPTGSFPSLYDISKRDWLGQPRIDERVMDEYSYIELGGIQFSGTVTGTFAALMACAPGSAPSFRGKIEKTQGLALGGQSQLNQMVGNLFANKNSRYPTIDMQLTENLRNLDIAPQESNRVIVTPDDTNRNISLDALYLPELISWRYDSQNSLMLPRVTLKNLLTGIVGETITIPASTTDPVGGIGGGGLGGLINTGFNVPSLSIPPIPSLVIPLTSTATNRPVWKGRANVTVSAAITNTAVEFSNFTTQSEYLSTQFLDSVGLLSRPTILRAGIYQINAWLAADNQADIQLVQLILQTTGYAGQQEITLAPLVFSTNTQFYSVISNVFPANINSRIDVSVGFVRAGGGTDFLAQCDLSIFPVAYT